LKGWTCAVHTQVSCDRIRVGGNTTYKLPDWRFKHGTTRLGLFHVITCVGNPTEKKVQCVPRDFLYELDFDKLQKFL
jgi:hypothetical protein